MYFKVGVQDNTSFILPGTNKTIFDWYYIFEIDILMASGISFCKETVSYFYNCNQVQVGTSSEK